jgi:hypothetical protein
MQMKGHNAKCPSCACNIIGICMTNSSNYTYYVLLHHNGETLYNPPDLPLCKHVEFLQNAFEVTHETTDVAVDKCAICYGIKGIPLLASLLSLEFLTSFPYNFMHLVWENVVKLLRLLWTGGSTNAPKFQKTQKPRNRSLAMEKKRSNPIISRRLFGMQLEKQQTWQV